MVKDAMPFLIWVDSLTSVENIGSTAGDDEPEGIFSAKDFNTNDDWCKQGIGRAGKHSDVS